MRAALNPYSKNVLGVRSIDQLLELFRYHDVTTSSRPDARLEDVGDDETTATSPHQDDKPHLQRPPIIEITSQHSAAGKSTLLYYLAARALLPIELSGKDSSVVWIDADGRFSAVRLHRMMVQLIAKSTSSSTSPLKPEITAQAALQNIEILGPSTSTQLLTQLTSLSSGLLKHIKHSPRPLSLLVLDSATAFYHQDRFSADMARLKAGGVEQLRPVSRTSSLITALRAVQSQFECAIAFSTQSLYTNSTQHQKRPASAASNNPNQPVPPPDDLSQPVSPWSSFATLTLQVKRVPVAQFAPTMTLEECLRDREKRSEAVAAGRFSVVVDRAGSDRWSIEVKEGIERLEGRGRFGLVISGEVVELAGA